jgi:hypothetical protein
MAMLKYQQSFLKDDPPSKYSGEPKASTFKKWVHEIHDWTDTGRLSKSQAICCHGKYSTGKAYRFMSKKSVFGKRSTHFLITFWACSIIVSLCRSTQQIDACSKMIYQQLTIYANFKTLQTQ